jgi:hypothetical protein
MEKQPLVVWIGVIGTSRFVLVCAVVDEWKRLDDRRGAWRAMTTGLRRRWKRTRNPGQVRQLVLPFLDRTSRWQQRFKRVILVATTLVIVTMLESSGSARHYLARSALIMEEVATREMWGLEPDRAMVEADWRLRRQRGVERTWTSLANFFRAAPEETKELFRVAGMDPAHALVRYGRGDEAFVISPQIFERDEHGRSYRLRPLTRSVWLRRITIRGGPFMIFQVLDTPGHRAAAGRAGAIVDEGSIQTTNSWGLRGAEPDPSASLRGIVLGDSFMQAMFNGDDATPTVYLEQYLRDARKTSVSILNTGHIGYSPEQYYYTLVEYGDRFHPQFLVISVCPNDFGLGGEVLAGRGDWFDEAEYWLGKIQQWCFARKVMFLLVPVPSHLQVETGRHDTLYPGKVCEIFHTSPGRYCFPLDEFIDEHLRLGVLTMRQRQSPSRSRLYNWRIDDNHFSPKGAALWARVIGRRLVRLLKYAEEAAKGVP